MRREYVHELFGAAAERFSDRTAIDAAAGPTTYRELEETSNRLANFLAAGGAPKGSPVAVVASDVAQIVAAILGTLKAGCAFVPVDPNLPAKRIEAMFAEVSPEWLIVESSAFDRVKGAARPGARVVCVGGGPLPDERERGRLVCLEGFADFRDASRPPVNNEPDDLCSVYFTSGSTGKPKGIAGRLKGIDHFIRWEMKTVGADESTRVSQLTSPSFDGFLKDVFVPLCAGGTVCVPEGRDIILDGRRLVDWIDEARLTVLHCVPSVFRSILNEELTPERFRHLRHVLLAGEPLLPSDVARWTEVFADRVRLTNLYGPTETTVVKLFYHVRPEDKGRRSIPIGQPMEGAAAIVMDAKGRPCPPGAVGEIYIRTPFRALGYYNRPEQTREVFVPNPFNDDPEDIVYRTGDFGRVAEDGLFEFLGRRDQQVKVRGVRVELGEVENALRAHPSVRDAAVVDREDLGGHKYLCAYVVAGEGVGAGALRRHLAESLPEYMLPSAFVLMERLPRTFNGKLDRRALPSPEQARRERPDDSTGPRTPTEELLAGIWSRVLGLQRVGPEDNFFELGGHSLLATQVMTRVRDAFQIELPLQNLFAAPTLGGLAAKVEQAVRERHGAETPRVERSVHEGEPPLSFPQQRMWTLSELERDGASYNVHANLRLEGSLGVPAFADALAEVVRRHESLRTIFPAEAGRPRQVVLAETQTALAQVDLSGLGADARERLAARLVTEEARRPFDLSEGPLLRAALLRLGPQEHHALFTMHHIVSDGWSLGVLTREVSALYGAFRAGRPSPLGELEIQYADFARWQREWLRGATLEARLAYWRGQLAGAPETLRLPADRPRKTAGPRRGANLAFTLDAGLTEKLKALGRREGVTLYMTLLAGFQALLHRLTGQDDIVVGSPIANRNQAETEALVGCFVNTLALRTSLAGDPTFRELLGRVRETALGAYAHQDIPFEAVNEALQRGARGRRAPLFRVWFVLQNAPLESVALEGVSVRARGADLGTAQFDLTLMMAEGPQGIGATLNYDSEMFDAGTAAALAEALQALLADAAEDADCPVLALRLGAESSGGQAARAATADEAQDQFVL